MLPGGWPMWAAALSFVAPELTHTSSPAATATAAPSLIEELPLSPEELALIESLGAAPAPPAPAPSPPPSPARALRGVGDVDPVFELRFAHALGARLVLAGRSGRQLAFELDGLALDQPLASMVETPAAALLDAADLDELVRAGAGLAGVRFVAPDDDGQDLSLAVEAASAERRVGGRGRFSGRRGALAWALDGRYGQAGDRRVPGAEADAETSLGRGAGSLRLELFGRPGEPARVVAGADLDLVHDRARPDVGPGAKDDLVRALRVFAGVDAAGSSFELGVRAAVADFELARGGVAEADRTFSGRVTGSLRPSSPIRLGLDVAGSYGEVRSAPAGSTATLDARATVALGLEPLDLSVTLGLGLDESALGTGPEALTVSGLRPLGELTLMIPLPAGLRLEAALTRARYAPSYGDLRRSKGLGIEDRTEVAGGPRLELGPVRAALVVGVTWLEGALDLDADGLLVQRKEATRLTGEARLLLRLLPRTTFGAVAALSSSSTDRGPLAGTSGVVGELTLRQTLAAGRGDFELRVRFGDPLGELSAYELARFGPTERAEFSFVTVGLSGGIDLGGGVRLEGRVGNLFDRRFSTFGSALYEPGVDLAVSLSFRPLAALTSGT